MGQHIGVAISGGGHRATIWGLGALLYLVDAGKNVDVGVISSVSGGSITNGVVAHEVDYSAVDAGTFDEKMAPLVRHVADDGLFFWARATNAYVISLLAALLLGALALLCGLVFMAVNGLTAVAGVVLLAGCLLLLIGAWQFERRSIVVDKALARTHFSTADRPTPLRQVARPVDHVICSTELQSGEHMYFSPRFVYSYAFGLGTPDQLDLSTAVQCSACLPGAFAARRLSTTPIAFRPGRQDANQAVLVDGGVYDNMADEWIHGLASRIKREPAIPAQTGIDEIVVVNASGPKAWSPFARAKTIMLEELSTLVRVNSVMYGVTTTRRRNQLVEEWTRASQTGRGMRGALVQINRSPYFVADAFASSTAHDETGNRARAVIASLGVTQQARAEWTDRTTQSNAVPTVLRSLGRHTTRELLLHAYALTMCNLHVILGYPLLPMPTSARFDALLNPAPGSPPAQ